MSNEIGPVLGGGADSTAADRTSRNVFHETFLLREQLLERRRHRQATTIVTVVLIAVVLVTTGFVMFAMLA